MSIESVRLGGGDCQGLSLPRPPKGRPKTRGLVRVLHEQLGLSDDDAEKLLTAALTAPKP